MSTEWWPDYQPRYVRPGAAASEHDFDRRNQADQLDHLDQQRQLQPPNQLHPSPSRHYYPQRNGQPGYCRLSRNATPDCIVVECFLRVVSACIASAVVAASAVMYVLVAPDFTSFTSAAVDHLNWVIGIPIGGTALTWQLIRVGIQATGFLDDSTKALPKPVLVADIVVDALLAVGAVICAILAGFQAARHARQQPRAAGCETALSVLLGMLAAVSFGELAVAFVEEYRRRSRTRDTDKKKRRRFRHSSNSSVIEIVRQ